MKEKKGKNDPSYVEFFKEENKRAISIIGTTIDVFTNSDKDLAIKVIQERRQYNAALEEKISEHFDRVSKLKSESTSYLDLVFVDMVSCYERVYSHCSNIAKLFNNDKVYVYSIEEQQHFDNMKNRY